VVYRVQLEGLEQGWSAPTTQRSARYTNLRPGDYTFRVAARNWGGQWSVPAEMRFRVIRNRAAQEMEEALERERIDKEVYRATAERFKGWLDAANHKKMLAEADRSLYAAKREGRNRTHSATYPERARIPCS
jgi:GGDEF domain-containing protein